MYIYIYIYIYYAHVPLYIMSSTVFSCYRGRAGSVVSLRMLILGRLIAGVGVGITSAAGPAFISAAGLTEGMEMSIEIRIVGIVVVNIWLIYG